MPKKNNALDEFQKLKNELVADKVNEGFRKYPDKYIQKLEGIGFQYHEEDDFEKAEEDEAVPENKRQEYLKSYFEGEVELSESVLTLQRNLKNFMLVIDPFFGYITQQNRKKEVRHAARN